MRDWNLDNPLVAPQAGKAVWLSDRSPEPIGSCSLAFGHPVPARAGLFTAIHVLGKGLARAIPADTLSSSCEPWAGMDIDKGWNELYPLAGGLDRPGVDIRNLHFFCTAHQGNKL